MKKIKKFIFFPKIKKKIVSDNLFFFFVRHSNFDSVYSHKVRLILKKNRLQFIKMKNKQFDLMLLHYYTWKYINNAYKGMGVVNVGYFVVYNDFFKLFLLYCFLYKEFHNTFYPMTLKISNQFINVIFFKMLVVEKFFLYSKKKMDLINVAYNNTNKYERDLIELKNSFSEYHLRSYFVHESYNLKFKLLFLFFIKILLSRKFSEVLH